MAKKSSVRRINIISLLLITAFGLLVIAMTYQALIAPTRTTPQAASVNTLFKRWEFNAQDAEGWKGNGATLAVRDGLLVITVNRDMSDEKTSDANSVDEVREIMARAVSVSNEAVATVIPRGIKYISLRLSASGDWINPVRTDRLGGAVRDGVISDSEEIGGDVQGVATNANSEGAPCDPIYTCKYGEEGICRLLARIPGWCRLRPSVMPRPSCIPRPPCLDSEKPCNLESKEFCPPGVTPAGKTIILVLTYRTGDGKAGARPLIIKGVADGTFHTYKARLPEVEDVDMRSLKLHLLGAARYSELKIDWLRLLGTPTAVPSVKPSPRVSQTPKATKTPRPAVSPTKPPVSVGCRVDGCSGQLCVSADAPPMYTTCEYREEYGCYHSATCARQNSGTCGWVMTDELKTCLDNASR